jgi:hypothetical protein
MPAQLVIFDDNYADEFDVEGFRVFPSKEDLDRFLSKTEDLCNKIVAEHKAKLDKKTREHYRQMIGSITEDWKNLFHQDKETARKKSYYWYEVFTKTENEYVEEKTRYSSVDIEVGFGTNEGFTYSGYEDYRRSLKIKELTDEQYQVLKELFGRGHDDFTFNEFADILESYEVYDDSDDGLDDSE